MIYQDGGPVVVQPGSTETNSLNEISYIEKSGMSLIDIQEDYTFNIEIIPSNKRAVIYLQIDISNLESLQDLNKVIKSQLRVTH